MSRTTFNIGKIPVRSQIAFVIGWTSGVSELVAARAPGPWSLSRLSLRTNGQGFLLLEADLAGGLRF